MKDIEYAMLWCRTGGSNKDYELRLRESSVSPGSFDVFCRFGPHGQLNQATFKASRVSLAKAKSIFDKTVREKQAKGYVLQGSLTNGHQATGQLSTRVQTNHFPMLLNAISQDEFAVLHTSPEWMAQEKADGERRMVHLRSGRPFGTNRKAQEVEIPGPVARILKDFGSDVSIDGELVNDRVIAFDLLHYNGADLAKVPYLHRYQQLWQMLEGCDVISAVPTVTGPQAIWSLYERLRRENAEGIVLKQIDAPYTPGKSHGAAFKFKFKARASVVVIDQNHDKASFSMGIYEEGSLRSCGNCTIPVNKPTPAAGQIAEIEYLYVKNKGGALFQPVFLGVRDDIPESDCNEAQLKYMRKEDGEEE